MRLPQSAAAQAAALEVEAAWREPAEAGERARWERVEAENEDGSVTLRADLDGEGKVRTSWRDTCQDGMLLRLAVVTDVPLARYAMRSPS